MGNVTAFRLNPLDHVAQELDPNLQAFIESFLTKHLGHKDDVTDLYQKISSLKYILLNCSSKKIN